MVKTLTVKLDIPHGRKLEIQLPDDVPTGPAEVSVVVTTAEAQPAGEPYAWADYCLKNPIKLGRSDLSANIEEFTGRRF